MDRERERELACNVTVDDVLFRSANGEFSVLSAIDDATQDKLVLVGELRDSAKGETLRVHGRFEQHPSYGKRFRVTSFTPIVPTTAAGIARYLGSGLIPGVGVAMAQRLVERFGDRTLDVITTQSGRLREVSGIGPQRAGAIADAVRSRKAEAEELAFLHSLGLGPSAAKRIRQKYGSEASRVIRDDPYLAAEQVHGIGFRTADAMAKALGYAQDDPRRAAGAVLHLLGRAADDGNCFLTQAELREQASELDVPDARLLAAIDELAQRELVQREDDAIYAPPLYRAEVEVAQLMHTLAAPRVAPKDAAAAIEAAIAAFGGKLAAAQQTAVRVSFDNGLLVVTGGPGTGKTTTTRAIVEAQHAVDRRVLLCAPTGRAAKRLSEATGASAQTIHRLLEWNPGSGAFARDRRTPLEADLVLVDEVSMLDVQLMHKLLLALPKRAALVLVGDVDQLPPIGAGPVLRELLASNSCPVVRLHEVFRQAEQSAIVRGAHAMLAGKKPTPTASGTRGDGDLFLVRATDPDVILTRLGETLDRMQQSYGLDPMQDVQVLSPMRRGPLGIEALNRLLQAKLNPDRQTKLDAGPGPEGRVRMRAGDKVMQLKNDYEREVWNGDLGRVLRVDAGIAFVQLGAREVSYEPDAQDALSLAYACTVHKVQGSEFPAVVLVLHKTQHLLLTRALVYTAITRARKLVVILGDEAALVRAIGNTRERRVNTRLAKRLTELAQRPATASWTEVDN